ncbi:MAG TPA: ATP-binding cassette domain-containing protein [Baekduia sp.]|nr:ATP-binding cassette domain-containing protein [Baekduia sp.]HET6505695.1 ATP-binding cassette domain-containing protein [Baekduia sp.]
MEPLFALEEVTVTGAMRPRLDRVSMALGKDGGVTVLQGPSGSGKSTLLRLLNRLVAPDAGRVRYRGADLATHDVLAHRREVGMVFQAPVLFPGTVADNLAVAEPDEGTDLAALLARCGLAPEDFLEREAATLSGGEAQRACLARALGTRPRVLLMDEPTSALDADATATIEALTRRLAGEGVAIVLVTHDRAQAARLGDRVIVLREGRVAA